MGDYLLDIIFNIMRMLVAYMIRTESTLHSGVISIQRSLYDTF